MRNIIIGFPSGKAKMKLWENTEDEETFEYGKTFDVSLVPDGYTVAVCFDVRMKSLVSETRTERGQKRNRRNMTAWYEGFYSR